MPDHASRLLIRRLLVASLAWCALAGAAYAVRMVTFGDRPAYINVRWAPGVDEATRVREEGQYSLRRPEFREGRTWGYALSDLSRANVTALVKDPAVEDTHNINRVKFRPGLFTQRFPYDTPTPWMPVGLNVLATLLALGGVLAIGLALIELAAPAMLRRPRFALAGLVLDPRLAWRAAGSRLTAWLGNRIPPVTAEAAAAFRIVFGGALLQFLLTRPVPAAWAAAPQNVVTGPQQLVLSLFTQSPWLAGWILPWVFAWGALFIAGALTRLSFAMLTVGAFAWAVLFTTRVTHHAVSALMMTLLFLQSARWGDAWSVDAWRRGTPPPPGARRGYGYAVWVPSLVLGVVLAAASVAKLRESGLAWILNGTVKYHFVSDSTQAPVDWGLHVGQHPWLAIALSFGAIVIESSVLIGVLSRGYAYRLAAGAAALSLLCGFELFQGLWWPAWWILLLSFLPWHLVPARRTRAIDSRPSLADPVQRLGIAVVAVFLLQLVVSGLKLEVRPLLSTYDMYSTTYDSEADYAHKAGVAYWVVAYHADGSTHDCHVTASVAAVVSRAIADATESKDAAAILDLCFASAAAPVARISVEGRGRTIDWQKWPPVEVVTTPMAGPIALASQKIN